MVNYIKDAQEYSDEIKHYFNNTGLAEACSQATFPLSKLKALVGKAGNSKNNRSDIAVIKIIIEEIEEFIKEKKAE